MNPFLRRLFPGMTNDQLRALSGKVGEVEEREFKWLVKGLVEAKTPEAIEKALAKLERWGKAHPAIFPILANRLLGSLPSAAT